VSSRFSPVGVTDAALVDLVALVEGETNRLSGSDRGVEMCLDCLEHEFVSASDLLDTALRNVLEAVAGDRNATESPGDDDATDHRRADSMDPGGNDETDGSDATTDPDGSDGGDAAAGRVPASVSASVSVSVSRLTVDGEEYIEVLIECENGGDTGTISIHSAGKESRRRSTALTDSACGSRDRSSRSRAAGSPSNATGRRRPSRYGSDPPIPTRTAGSGRESEPSWTTLRVRSRDEDRHRGGTVSSPVAAAGTNGAATGRTWNGRTGGTATEERKRHRGRVTATGGDRGDGGDQRDEHATRLREGDAPFERRSMEQSDR
jgi:hypothetical protein